MNDLLHIVKDDAPHHGRFGHHHHPQQQPGQLQPPRGGLRYQQPPATTQQQRYAQQQPQQYEQHYEQQAHDQNDYGHDLEAGRSNGWDTHGSGSQFAAPGLSDDMQQFFAKSKEIQTYMSDIRHRQHELWQMHEQSKTLVRRQDILPHRQRMQEAVNQVNTLAHRTKNEIQLLDEMNAHALQQRGHGVGSASERTRTSITAGLKKKLKDLMGEFSELRARIHDENRQVVERRVYTVTGQHLPEEEIDHMIETGQAETIFQRAILEQGRGRVLDTLAEIQERNRAVKDLEASLLELHQIFLDMAVLVEAQGEMLDNIEQQVNRAVDYVGGGTKALVEAKQYQKSKRKWCCCAIITLLIIIIIVVVVVVVVYVVPNLRKDNKQK